RLKTISKHFASSSRKRSNSKTRPLQRRSQLQIFAPTATSAAQILICRCSLHRPLLCRMNETMSTSLHVVHKLSCPQRSTPCLPQRPSPHPIGKARAHCVRNQGLEWNRSRGPV